MRAEQLNAITRKIISAAVAVHHELGPGLLESAYEACLAFELAERHMWFERQKGLPVTYRGQILDCGYRIDLLVLGAVVVEVKAIERFEPIHIAQVLSYLKMSSTPIGLLLNFNVRWLTAQGIRRVVHKFPE